MIIYGAGMAGLLAANVFRKEPMLSVMEEQSQLPSNHHAVLRHRERHSSDASGIGFRAVTVTKVINYEGKFFTQATPKLANLYSMKVTGEYSSRSIWNLSPVKRYIAPPNFIPLLAQGIEINYNEKIRNITASVDPVISTIPMPIMMRLAGFRDPPEFNYRSIYTYTGYIDFCDLYQTVYYPNPKLDLYRMSITGNKVIAEFMRHPRTENKQGLTDNEYVEHFLNLDFGINAPLTNGMWSERKYGKIVDIDETTRKKFIALLTQKFNIYSLGRYATWRNILLDDVYHDIQQIKILMSNCP